MGLSFNWFVVSLYFGCKHVIPWYNVEMLALDRNGLNVWVNKCAHRGIFSLVLFFWFAHQFFEEDEQII